MPLMLDENTIRQYNVQIIRASERNVARRNKTAWVPGTDSNFSQNLGFELKIPPRDSWVSSWLSGTQIDVPTESPLIGPASNASVSTSFSQVYSQTEKVGPFWS